ncbi:lysine--tRNA ligase [Nannocystis sp. ILAH1]|uniref:lysine--tRNA ligase n=1 Tax=Nannocystis sp. ILAH1 TaxID=2996789 RepID=UPI00226EDE90|nr:lysine--tRNA ligase [Nannocystis sp. ILAH1]MCY0988201.1 lysine--tRNA ligase [Nannocystis sp. ILAH1]
MDPAAGHDPYLNHWADAAAAKTLAAHSDAKVVTVAAGITPSGVVHVGNFREVITVDLVARALRDRGADVRFIYSWDDFDVLRKVPADMPQRDMLTENLRRSISAVPDPYGEHDSYAGHNIAAFEKSLAPLGIRPEFIRQSQRYRAGAYADGIRLALKHAADIRAVLNSVRDKTTANTRLEDNWLPLSGFCDNCGRDTLTFAVEGEWTVHYDCSACKHAADVDLRQGGNLKLPWRIDWPMRWAHERVCFEPGGKDHSTAGGSFDTAKDIVRVVYGWQAPEYVGYDFVRIKGRAGKISSSKGDVVTVSDCLEIYEPEVLRWLFVSFRPNTEFQISFDLDVITLYENFDRTRRIAYGVEPAKDAQARLVAQRTMQLASVDHRRIAEGDVMPFVPGFRHLSMTLQIFEGDLDKTVAYYEEAGQVVGDESRRLTRQRARCVWNWIAEWGPDEFRYKLRREPKQRELSADEATCLARLVAPLRGREEIREDELVPTMKALCEGTSLDNKTFLPVVYDLLIGRDKGPKLTTLITAIGPARALSLLVPSLPAGT